MERMTAEELAGLKGAAERLINAQKGQRNDLVEYEYSEAANPSTILRLVEQAGRVEGLEKALQRIARWHGEFPSAGVWEDGTPKSYGGAFGSNGERDYMRQVALDALASPASQLDAPAPPEVAVEQKPVAWGLLSIQEPELTNDEQLAAYWERKGRKVTALYAAPLHPIAVNWKCPTCGNGARYDHRGCDLFARDVTAACRALVAHCNENPPMGESLWCVQQIRQALSNVKSVATELPATDEQTVHQYRAQHCSDWYDGHPDHSDGGEPYETRTLYRRPAPSVPVAAGLPAIPEPTQEMFLAAEREGVSFATQQKCLRAWSAADPVLPVEQPSQPAVRTAGCTLCGVCAATGERVTASPIAEPDTATQADEMPISVSTYGSVAECEKEHARRAATQAAKPMTDEQILELAEATGINWTTDERRPDNATIIDFARALESILKGE